MQCVLHNLCIVACVVCEQLQYSCERHLSELATMSETGDSLSKCLALTAELQDFEKRSKVSCCSTFSDFLTSLHASNNARFIRSDFVTVGGCYCVKLFNMTTLELFDLDLYLLHVSYGIEGQGHGVG